MALHSDDSLLCSEDSLLDSPCHSASIADSSPGVVAKEMEVQNQSLLLCLEDSATSGLLWEGGDASINKNPELQEEVLLLAGSASLQCSPLDKGLVESMLRREVEHMPKLSYVQDVQGHNATARERTRLVDWIMKVQMYHDMDVQTVALCVNYFDRFLSCYCMPEEPWGHQLVATTCLLLAAKMEEVNPPCITDLQVGAPDFFKLEVVRHFEVIVLATLQWRLGAVTPYAYLVHCFQVLKVPSRLWQPILDSCVDVLLHSLRDIRMQAFRPSIVAAAIVWCVLANAELRDEDCEWTSHVADLSESLGCSLCDLQQCHRLLDEVVFGPIEPTLINSSGRAEESVSKDNNCSPTSVLESPSQNNKRQRTCGPLESPVAAKRGRYSTGESCETELEEEGVSYDSWGDSP